MQSRQHFSLLLVALQFGLMFMQLALAFPMALASTIPAGAWLPAGLSLALAVWALAANRIGNFNIRPLPKPGGQLITHGPYRLIRHPMYTSVLLGALALAWTAGGALAWLTWGTLVLVLIIKSILEERWMGEQHSGYAAYRVRTWRFLPGLF